MKVILTNYEIKEAIAEKLKIKRLVVNYIPEDIVIESTEFGHRAIVQAKES